MNPAIVNYVEREKWFLGIRREEDLFKYSLRAKSQKDLMDSIYGVSFVETLLCRINSGEYVRAFNLAHAKQFHSFSNSKILANPTLLTEQITQDGELWEKIFEEAERLSQAISQDDYPMAVSLFRKIMGELYPLFAVDSFVIFSLGRELTSSLPCPTPRDVKEILTIHDTWRNSIAFKEEKLDQILDKFLTLVKRKEGIESSVKDIKKYLVYQEFISLLEKKSSCETIQKIIEKRMNSGYVFHAFRDESGIGVSEEREDIEKVTLFLSSLKKINQNQDLITGSSCFQTDKRITGEVIIIKDKTEWETKASRFKDKVLVAIQTTPHFIPFLSKIKGIITDEGGITCHAAIVSREMGIPAIVGTGNATELLKDGEVVEMDLNKGTIRKI